MKAKSIKGHSTDDIQTALEECMKDGFKPTLAFLFISIKQDREEICKLFSANNITIFGATTAGEFTDQGIEKDSSAILLLEMNPGSFELLYSHLKSNSSYETAQYIGKKGKEKFSNPGFIISGSGINQEGKLLVNGIIDASQTSTLIGGMAGDDTYEKTTVFTNDFSSDEGIIALAVDLDKTVLKGEAVSGWKPVGTVKTVTKSDGPWILTIDDEPALDMLIHFLGIKIDSNTSDEELRKITVTFPFEVYLEDGGSLMVPPLMFNQKSKGILVPRGIDVGTKLKFTLPPDFDVIDRVIQTARNVKEEGLDSTDAMVIFSCVGRLMTLGPLVNEEIKGLDKVWNVPMAGFFSHGEFGSTTEGPPDFVGTTCSWVVLKEK